MLFTDETPCLEMPGHLHTTHQLRQAQRAIAALANRPADRAAPIQDVALAEAAGRVLARDLAVPGEAGARCPEPTLRAGTRLDWRHLPRLAAGGHGTVPVHAPVRCGVIALRAPGTPAPRPQDKVAAVTLQAALGRLGAKALGASAAGTAARDEPALRMLAPACDLLVAVTPAGGLEAPARGPAQGVRPPRVFRVAGRPCVVLPDCPTAALAGFVAFGVPLVRRLQGRWPELPPLRTAIDDHAASAMPIGPGLACIGDVTTGEVSGIAWRAGDPHAADGRPVAYLSLDEWLG